MQPSRKHAKTIAEVEGQTQDKRSAPKEFVVEHDDSGLYVIKLTAGGEVNDTLKGKWTTIVRAQAAIDNFLATREQENEKEKSEALQRLAAR